jgi:hypothetical protein
MRSLTILSIAAIVAVPIAIIAEVITFQFFVSVGTPGVALAAYWILPAIHQDVLSNLWPLALVIDSIIVFCTIVGVYFAKTRSHGR